jgi:hypothetical protein
MNDSMGRFYMEIIVTISSPYTRISLEELRKALESKENISRNRF